MHGLLLIDKPSGLSSHDVVRQVRRIFKTRKVGHAGTLDPLATGVLPVALGEGTKLLQFLLSETKAYRATMRLGIATDTLDSEGQVVSTCDLPEDTIRRLSGQLPKFTGKIQQIPPMYSALKRDGVPLYKLARAGQTVERELRIVTIEKLELLNVSLPDVDLEVACSKGTYIRSLCADIGESIGCGAHITALRRIRTGQYSIGECVSLEQLHEVRDILSHPAFLSVDKALFYYPAIELSDAAATKLMHGVPPVLDELETPVQANPDDYVRLVYRARLLAMARFAPERQKEIRGDFELIRIFNCHDNE